MDITRDVVTTFNISVVVRGDVSETSGAKPLDPVSPGGDQWGQAVGSSESRGQALPVCVLIPTQAWTKLASNPIEAL